jgi:hypothetical protein
VAECNELELPVNPEPQNFPEHCILDFNAHKESAWGKKAKALQKKALARGWQHQASIAEEENRTSEGSAGQE